jgi:hypothetical protein
VAFNQTQHYRAIGGQLALYLRQSEGPWPSTASLQGMAADLVGAHTELALPLRELVSRPAFRALAEKAGSGGGLLERDALLQDLQCTFAPAVVAGLAEVLNGMLDLPSIPAEPAPEQRPVSPPSEPPRSVEQPRPARRPSSRVPLVVLLSLGTAAVAAALVLLSRTSPLCGAFGLCPQAVGLSQSPSALQAALAAEQALRRAGSVDDYASALEQLERELLKLSGDPLSSEQQQQLSALQATARDARQTLQAERADQEALARAEEAIAAAKASPAVAQTPQLTAARQALDAIPPRSFSAAEASRLRAALEELMRQAASAAEPTAPDQATPAPQAPPSAPAASQPRWTPPPSAPQPAPAPSAPSRDQSLF